MKKLSTMIALAMCLAPVVAEAHAASDPAQEARANLNSQQAEFARHQLEQNAAERQAYAAAVEARAAKISQDQLAYEAAQKAHDAEIRQYQEKLQKWRADTAACQAGDRTRCAANTPQ